VGKATTNTQGAGAQTATSASATAGTKPKSGLTRRTAWLYGLGSAAYGVKDNGFAYILMIYYSQVLGVPATLFGSAMFVALLFDAVSDPLVGYWSDNTRSRWGRRHPFMYASVVPVTLSWLALWNPPLELLGPSGLWFYLVAMAILVRLSITFYEIPNTALAAELTDDYDERTWLFGLRYMLGWGGGLLAAILGWGVFFRATEEYPYGVLNPEAYLGYSLASVALIVGSVLVSSIGLHREIPRLRQPPPASSRTVAARFAELRHTLSNRNFLWLFLTAIFAATAAGIGTNLNSYVYTYFWELESRDVLWINLPLILSAAAAALTAPWLTARFDKKHTALGVFAAIVVINPFLIVLRLVGWFPDNDWAGVLPAVVLHAMVDVWLICLFGITLASMMADVVEHSEASTARREEGLFFAARTFAAKATTGLGTLMAGIALDWIAFPRGAGPGEVPTDSVAWLGIVYGPLLTSFYLLAGFALRNYDISRGEHDERVRTLRGD
jgi:GPH family glycoside/pentoside/hexuronide:cation symporter